jgi:hypothetical protein
MSFISMMQAIGRDVLRAFEDVVRYLPPAVTVASMFFPITAVPLASTVASVNLIQQAIVMVEQKFAAAGKATGTGQQKLADVLTYVKPTVTQLLLTDKITVNDTKLTNIINAIVAILNAQDAPAPLIAPAT